VRCGRGLRRSARGTPNQFAADYGSTALEFLSLEVGDPDAPLVFLKSRLKTIPMMVQERTSRGGASRQF